MSTTQPDLPVFRKVKASTTAATIAGVAVWVLCVYVNPQAQSLPAPVEALVAALLPGLSTLAAGWGVRETTPPYKNTGRDGGN